MDSDREGFRRDRQLIWYAPVQSFCKSLGWRQFTVGVVVLGCVIIDKPGSDNHASAHRFR